jgi:hypothetical protein
VSGRGDESKDPVPEYKNTQGFIGICATVGADGGVMFNPLPPVKVDGPDFAGIK